MRQLVQSLRSGETSVADVPPPVLRNDGILVRSTASLVSAGTERMVMQLAKKTLVGKARERPDLVRKTLTKLRRDGFWATFQAVRDRLDQDMPLGYSVCGTVIRVGQRAGHLQVGQRVACAGAGYANHAEVNYIPRLLAATVPDGVDDESAAYTTVGAIALQGIRNAEIHLGEVVVVLGLGLLGQLTVQLLKVSGCEVIALDPVAQRVELAAAHGADLALLLGGEDLERTVMEYTRGRGADAVVITAATKSNGPIELAARLARERARIVLVGVTGMQIPRKLYYEKELQFIVSRSYGPGRYDTNYEEHGLDYPPGYVRWTEQRNMEAFLALVRSGTVTPRAFTTHRFPIKEAMAAFELILENREPHLGVVLTYPHQAPPESTNGEPLRIPLRETTTGSAVERVGISFVGAGGFARSVLLPALSRARQVDLRGIFTASGLSARAAGKRFGFEYCATDPQEFANDSKTDAVFVATPHSHHATGVCQALRAGKAVFVEKPMAINLEQLATVLTTLDETGGRLLVGYNRRFSPLASKLKEFLCQAGPLSMTYRCNAGQVPPDHWVSDPAEGGRIVGEACHFFDFFAFLTEASPKSVFAARPEGGDGQAAAVTVSYGDGSVGQLFYTSDGPAAFGKEQLEVFACGRAAVLRDFRSLELHTETRRQVHKIRLGADKGHAGELTAFIQAVQSGSRMPIEVPCLIGTTLVTFAVHHSLQDGRVVSIHELLQDLARLTRPELGVERLFG